MKKFIISVLIVACGLKLHSYLHTYVAIAANSISIAQLSGGNIAAANVQMPAIGIFWVDLCISLIVLTALYLMWKPEKDVKDV